MTATRDETKVERLHVRLSPADNGLIRQAADAEHVSLSEFVIRSARAAARAYVTHVPDGWYRRMPFLPVPDRAWLRFRLVTAYGDPDRAPEPVDVITWLEWLRGWRALAQ